MRKKTWSLITREELKKMNREIVPMFGPNNRITSGSIYTCNGRKLQCNIVVGETTVYKSEVMLKQIGAKVKTIIGADEVYSFGVKLA